MDAKNLTDADLKSELLKLNREYMEYLNKYKTTYWQEAGFEEVQERLNLIINELQRRRTLNDDSRPE